MVRLVRRLEVPSHRAKRLFVGLRQPGFRAYAMELRGMRYDAAWLGTKRKHVGFRNELTIVLEGAWVDRRGGRPVRLGPGELRCGPASPLLVDRWDGEVRLVTLEWDTPRLTGFARMTARRPIKAAAEALFSALTTGGASEAALRRLVDALTRERLPVPRPDRRAVPASAWRSAALLNHALSCLETMPAWSDFTKTRSERQWRRDLATAREWLGLPGGSFRSTLNRVRLQFAVSLASVPGLKTPEIAARLGYRSDRALLLAFTRAGIELERVRTSADFTPRRRPAPRHRRPPRSARPCGGE